MTSARLGAGRCPRPGGLAAAVAAVVMTIAAGCGSGHSTSADVTSPTSASTSTPATLPPSTVPTTAGNQLPTVPDCGGGAYEPKTLLIVCGTGTAMATGVSWRSWTPAGAAGSGTVHLAVQGQATTAPATLTLDQVVRGPVGLQFSRLTVTWMGKSPDGKTQDVYRLQLVG